MTHAAWIDVKEAIMNCPEAERYRLQPKLDRVIHGLKSEGLRVPPEAQQLNAELLAEAVEARFDNVPV
ncbi:MAG: hypothetical protein AB8B82_15700 [Roseovarius sp.]